MLSVMPDPKPTSNAERRRQGLRKTVAHLSAAARFARRMVHLSRPVVRLAGLLLKRALEVLLAIVIVFEEWGWRPLAQLIASLARYAPIARLEMLVRGLPPYPALAVFALPGLMLLPLKLLALALIAQGHVVWATLLFVGAKVGGTAIVARIFQLTQPALMQLGWFVRLHDTVMPWKHALVERVRASRTWRVGRVIKFHLKHRAHEAWTRLQPLAASYVERVRALLRVR